jgi:hypothetical protein
MARETKYKGMWGDWQSLMGKVEVNKDQLPQLEPFRLKLGVVLNEALRINQQQEATKATKQEATKQLRKLGLEGNRLAALLRQGIKEHYGVREEEIAKFGLQPFRGRKAKPAPEEPVTPILPVSPVPKP